MPIDRSTTTYEIPTDQDFVNVDLEDSIFFDPNSDNFYDESDYLLDNVFDY